MARRAERPLKRRVGTAREKRTFLVFTEGARTEPGYVLAWARELREHIAVSIDPRHGGPLTLVKAAVQAAAENERARKKGRGDVYDEIWCIFDRDEHPDFKEALSVALANDLPVAVSNPCIELWFILHFRDQTAHIHRHDAQAESEHLLKCGKNLSHEALAELVARFEEAKRRAVALDVRHEGNGSPPHSNPSSSVQRLIGAFLAEPPS
jgi:hypothetical protein